MKTFRQNNGVFHEFNLVDGMFFKNNQPYLHFLRKYVAIPLTEQNALEYGYEPAENHPREYGVWLIESGTWLAEINRAYAEAVRALAADVPEEEQKGWASQRAQAEAYAADANTPTPYIDGLVASRSTIEPITKSEMVGRILAKVALYETAHSYLTGLRQGKEKALLALDPETVTHEDVFAITLDYPLDVS